MASVPLLPDRDGRRVFVALGDSFTEGVGDYDPRFPNGVRGWADRVAEKLAKAQPGWEYANLAIRSKRLRHIIGEQLEPALGHGADPHHAVRGRQRHPGFRHGHRAPSCADYESLVAALAGTGATLVLFTGFDVKVSALLEPLKKTQRLLQPAGPRDRRPLRRGAGGLLVLRRLP